MLWSDQQYHSFQRKFPFVNLQGKSYSSMIRQNVNAPKKVITRIVIAIKQFQVFRQKPLFFHHWTFNHAVSVVLFKWSSLLSNSTYNCIVRSLCIPLLLKNCQVTKLNIKISRLWKYGTHHWENFRCSNLFLTKYLIKQKKHRHFVIIVRFILLKKTKISSL